MPRSRAFICLCAAKRIGYGITSITAKIARAKFHAWWCLAAFIFGQIQQAFDPRDDGAVNPATTIDERDSATPNAMVRLLAGLYQGRWLSPASRHYVTLTAARH